MYCRREALSFLQPTPALTTKTRVAFRIRERAEPKIVDRRSTNHEWETLKTARTLESERTLWGESEHLFCWMIETSWERESAIKLDQVHSKVCDLQFGFCGVHRGAKKYTLMHPPAFSRSASRFDSWSRTRRTRWGWSVQLLHLLISLTDHSSLLSSSCPLRDLDDDHKWWSAKDHRGSKSLIRQTSKTVCLQSTSLTSHPLSSSPASKLRSSGKYASCSFLLLRSFAHAHLSLSLEKKKKNLWVLFLLLLWDARWLVTRDSKQESEEYRYFDRLYNG